MGIVNSDIVGRKCPTLAFYWVFLFSGMRGHARSPAHTGVQHATAKVGGPVHRDRRYQSASALAEDVERYLRDESVLAGPPSTG